MKIISFGLYCHRTGKRRILLVSGSDTDAVAVMSLYSQQAEVVPFVAGRKAVPYTVEELSKYDEIIL